MSISIHTALHSAAFLAISLKAVTDTRISSWKVRWKLGMIIAHLSGRYQSQTCLVRRVEAEKAFPGSCDTGCWWASEGGWVNYQFIKIFCCFRDMGIVEK
jgi:hypothetical protein